MLKSNTDVLSHGNGRAIRRGTKLKKESPLRIQRRKKLESLKCLVWGGNIPAVQTWGSEQTAADGQ